MAGPFAIGLATLLIVGSPAPSPDSNVAIKLAPENDHVNPLPLSSDEAARRFGLLSPAQVQAVEAVAGRLMAKKCDSSKWDGPALFVSHSAELDYRPTSLATFCKQLSGKKLTAFDPYSLGKNGDETFAVVMVRVDPTSGTQASWTAIAFALSGDAVSRVIIAPQPWIHLLSEHN